MIGLQLPGLKDRPADLMRIAENCCAFFAAGLGKKTRGLSAAVREAFVRYPWPGNLRELRNVIERAVILSTGDMIETLDLPEEFSHHQADANVAVGARVTLDQVEAEHIRRTLACARNLDEAARTLGIDPATLYRKRQKLGLL